jgi:DNA-binding CsgD family transcriptional regulator
VLCIASELSNSETAAKLGVGVRTVETHLSRLLRKSGARSRAGLIARCYAAGILVPGNIPPEYSGSPCLTV